MDERKLNTVGCNDLEKVRYATHLLCVPAASWWDNIVAVYSAEKVFTWEEFKRKFRESNVPESIVELKRREFESLEQKDKTILTYVREFSKLSRYAVEEVNTEDKKKKRFLWGLSPQFKVQLGIMRATEFQELVDAAITLANDFKQLQDEKRKKAKFEPKRFVSNKPNTSLSFKPRYNNNNNYYYYYNSRKNQAFQTANQIVCRSCGGKGHFSKDCKKPRIICFGCREEGHMLRDCPKNKSGGGGSRGGNTRGNWKNKKPFGKLNCTSLEEVVNSDQAVIDLFILPMKDIDVILGMNWLEANGALIDCMNKTVSLKSPDGSRMIYQGDKHTQIEVELQLNSMKEVKLEDIPVVNEFQDVFPKELPGMPPDREIEFTIDLIPGTAPIAKAPYKMGPKELKELKEQLDDLEQKGKANVVADALSRKSTGGVEQELSPELRKEISQAQIQLWEKEAHEGLSALQVADELNVNLKNEIMMGQLDDPFIVEEMRRIDEDFGGSWEEHLPLAEFSYNNSYQSSIKMAPFEALYGRKCRSPICWYEAGASKEFNPDYVKEKQQIIDIIRDRLKIAQSRQKSYADQKRRTWEPQVGDMVYLKVSPMKGLQRYGVKGKLSPRYIGPFKILSQNRGLAFELELPGRLSQVHNIFHVSQLIKCLKTPDEPVSHDELELQPDLTYIEKPAKILEENWKQLRNRAIKYCKIQWKHHPGGSYRKRRKT
ncbi:hypothetical protein QYE76_046720 [Lolium multiflorum]|uniref:CCHC-type domain-containing protein n=1 Tax=Lolium multiflorum TaxID=4521 RepID=A0AAD8TQB3_LOLMU|nr:hypothetical protein QYE76_046720 [Lolium multiflorum]